VLINNSVFVDTNTLLLTLHRADIMDGWMDAAYPSVQTAVINASLHTVDFRVVQFVKQETTNTRNASNFSGHWLFLHRNLLPRIPFSFSCIGKIRQKPAPTLTVWLFFEHTGSFVWFRRRNYSPERRRYLMK